MVFKIYKISCIDQELCKEEYIGSTEDEHIREMAHKSDCNNPNAKNYNTKVYQTIREYGGWENWKFEIIEVCDESINIPQLAKEREEFWRKTLNATLNMYRAFRTEEERLAYQAQHYEEHKEEKLAYQAQHYQDNKEEKLAYQAQYNEEHKEEIAAQKAERITCECGSNICRGAKAQHERTQKHQNFIKSKMDKQTNQIIQSENNVII
tara:strand:- start:597 stop:1220 length:624 start_codon:yes stop_codon:yes gene_type:complete